MGTIIAIAVIVGFMYWYQGRKGRRPTLFGSKPIEPKQPIVVGPPLPPGNYADPNCPMCKGRGRHQSPTGGNFMVDCDCVPAGRDRARAKLRAQEEREAAEYRQETDDILRNTMSPKQMMHPHGEPERTPEQQAKIDAAVDEAMRRAGYGDDLGR